MRKIITLVVIIVFSTQFVDAQWNIHWRKIRHEVIFGVGGTNFLGELGGANSVGTHFIRDFDYQSSRWVVNAGYRYKLAEEWAVRGAFYYGRISGNDEFTEEIHRSNRDIKFRSPIAELTADIQYSILRERYGHRYDLRRVKGSANIPNLYVFAGISGIYFNPQGLYTDGKWYDLQPLATEGQDVMPTREKYSKFTVAVPVGIGLNYMLDKDLGIGFEYGVRYTFTDYMDDASTTYVDPSAFASNPIAAYFHNPNPDWIGAGPGNQRGNSNYNDAYMFLTINVTYKIRPKAPGRAKF